MIPYMLSKVTVFTLVLAAVENNVPCYHAEVLCCCIYVLLEYYCYCYLNHISKNKNFSLCAFFYTFKMMGCCTSIELNIISFHFKASNQILGQLWGILPNHDLLKSSSFHPLKIFRFYDLFLLKVTFKGKRFLLTFTWVKVKKKKY